MEYELLKENAKSNRKNMTEAESAFWTMVRGSTLGQRCVRQHVIGDYIVDFLFRKSKVVVEIDGGYHRPQTPLSPLFRGGLEQKEEKHLTGDILQDFANLPTKQGDRGGLWINDPEQVERDKERQDWLEHMGYKVVRFTNEEVLFDIENVINKIKLNL